MSLVHGCPIRTITFLCSVDRENGVKSLIWHYNKKVHIIGIMCTKFQSDWTSTSSKTTPTKNFNLEGTDGRTDVQIRKNNVLKWGIKQMNEKQICYTSKTTTTELQVSDLEQAHMYTDCGGVKHVSGIQTLLLTWDSGVTVQH